MLGSRTEALAVLRCSSRMMSTVALNSGRGCPVRGTARGVRENPLEDVEGLLGGVLSRGGGLAGGEPS